MAKYKKPVKKATTKPQQATEKKAATTHKNPFKVSLSVKTQAIIIFVFSLLIYVNTLGFDYNLDDGLMITENNFTKKGISGIPDIMFNDAFTGFFGENRNLLPGGRYRPLSQIWFAIEYEIFGLNPFVGHLVNILFYALTCSLLFLFLRKMLRKYDHDIWYMSVPFVSVLLFASHPLHTEVVANIKGRDEVMCLAGVFGTLWLTIKYMNTKKFWLIPLISLSFILAILSKESAVTFLAIVPMSLYVFYNQNLKKSLVYTLPMIAGFAGYFIIRYKALGFLTNDVVVTELLNDPYLHAQTDEKYATVFYTWGIYLKLLVFPHPLTHDYYPKHIPIINWSDIRAIASFLFYMAIIVFAVWKIWKRNIIAYGILFFLISFSIQSNLIFNIGAFMNERFVFISIFGFTLISAVFLRNGFGGLIKKPENSVIIPVFLLFVLTAYSLKTYTRNYAWKDGLTLFTTDAKVSVNSAKVNVSAGELLIKEAVKESTPEHLKNKYLRDALGYLDKGVRIHPQYTAGWILFGNAYLYLKQYVPARQSYDNALRISPKNKDALNNMLVVAQSSTRDKLWENAEAAYLRLLVIDPENFDYLFSLAVISDELNKTDTAMLVLNQLIEKDSTYYKAYNRLGQIYGKRFNNLRLSIAYLNKALSYNAEDASVWENLGVAYGISGQFEASIEAFKKSIEFSPENHQAYTNLGNSYMNIGRREEAMELFQKAQEVKVEAERKRSELPY